MLIYLSSIDIVKDKVKLLCRLKRVMEPNQERMFEAFQEHISLSHDVLLLIKRRKKTTTIWSWGHELMSPCCSKTEGEIRQGKQNHQGEKTKGQTMSVSLHSGVTCARQGGGETDIRVYMFAMDGSCFFNPSRQSKKIRLESVWLRGKTCLPTQSADADTFWRHFPPSAMLCHFRKSYIWTRWPHF